MQQTRAIKGQREENIIVANQTQVIEVELGQLGQWGVITLHKSACACKDL